MRERAICRVRPGDYPDEMKFPDFFDLYPVYTIKQTLSKR